MLRVVLAAWLMVAGVSSAVAAQFTPQEWATIQEMTRPWYRYAWAKKCEAMNSPAGYFSAAKVAGLRQELLDAIAHLPPASAIVVRDELDAWENVGRPPGLQGCKDLAALIDQVGGVVPEPPAVHVVRVDPQTVGMEQHWLAVAKACRHQGLGNFSAGNIDVAMALWQEELGLLSGEERVVSTNVMLAMHAQFGGYGADAGKCNGALTLLQEAFPSAF